MKMKGFDIAVNMAFILALVVIYFFWECQLDMYVTIMAGIVIVTSIVATAVQNKKLKQVEEVPQKARKCPPRNWWTFIFCPSENAKNNDKLASKW